MSRAVPAARRSPLAVGLLVALVLSLGGSAQAVVLPAGQTALLSGMPDLLTPFPTPADDAEVADQGLSGDGTKVVFASRSDGLAADDDDFAQGIYLKDLGAGESVRLISRASDQNGAPGEPNHESCSQGAISADGHAAVFICGEALDPLDDNGRDDVYLRNLDTGQTLLVSRAVGGAVGNAGSRNPVVARNGNQTFVAFASQASNLVAGAAGGFSHIYRATIENSAVTDMRLASASAAGTEAPETASGPSISDRGDKVAFTTNAGLIQGDQFADDVYVRNFSGQGTPLELASRNDADVVAGGTTGQISGDGNAVAFVSPLGGLDPTNVVAGGSHVYLRSLTAQTTRLRSLKAGTPADGNQRVTDVDQDGSVISFASTGGNIDDAAPGGGVSETYVSRNGSLELASRGNGEGPAATASTSGSLDAAGELVAFDDPVRGLTPDVERQKGSVAVRELDANRTRTISRPPGTAPFVNTGGDAGGGAVSGDGRFVAFVSIAPGLGVPAGAAQPVFGTTPALFLRDVQSDTVTQIGVVNPLDGGPLRVLGGTAISADGKRVAFVAQPAPNAPFQVYVRELPSGRTLLVSSANGKADVPGDQDSTAPSISDDGLRVAFTSRATNLDDGQVDGLDHVHVRDLATNGTQLVDRVANAAAVAPNAASFQAMISGDGRSVAFATPAALDPGDANAVGDIYVRRLAAGPTLLASLAGAATRADKQSFSPTISRDGNRVAFVSEATTLGGATGIDTQLYLRDIAAQTLTVVGRADGPDGAPVLAFSGLISPDGTHVALRARSGQGIAPGDPGDNGSRVYLRDVAGGTTRLVSRRPGSGGTPVDAEIAGITARGECVTMLSSLRSNTGDGDLLHVLMHVAVANCGRAVVQPPPPPGGPAVLSGLKLKPARFHVGGKKSGTRILFRLDKRSAVTLAFDRLLAGHRVKAKKGKRARCTTKPVRKGKKAKRCTVVRRVGRVALAASRLRAGANSVKFSGKLGRKALAPGRYRLTATPTRGKARTTTFVVVKAPKAKRKARR